mgnify:CR=1 FL=1
MSILNILRYPDPRLHKVAKPVTVFDERIKTLVADMAETMYDAPGVGLAASQVDVHEQVIVIDTSETHTELRAYINPEIIWASPEMKVYDEGCLSVPGVYDGVERHAEVKVRLLTLTASNSSCRQMACWRCVSSTKWIISRARYLLNTCRRSSAIASKPR